MILVVRREDDQIVRYVYLGTGSNYNDVTAGLYTDIGMMTAKESYASDVSTLFNVLSGPFEIRAVAEDRGRAEHAAGGL